MKANRIKLILVEDNDNDVDVISEVIEEIDDVNIVNTFSSGEGVKDFIETCDDKSNLVVFTDLNMPDKDGFELVQELKSETALRSIPVFVLSSSSRTADVQKSYEFGANSYFVKEHDFDKFESSLKNIFSFLTKHCKIS